MIPSGSDARGTAAALIAALEAGDLTAVGPLLHPAVDWYGDGMGVGCRSAEEVLAFVRPYVDEPGRPRLELVEASGDQALLRVWLDPPRWLLVVVERDGLIVALRDCASGDVARRDMELRAEGVPPAPACHASVCDLAPFLLVADLERATAFYGLLGFVVSATHEEDGRAVFARLTAGETTLMLAVADSEQLVRSPDVLYLYARDLATLRDRLVSCGVLCGQIVVGSPGPRRELRVDDPDGRCVMVAEVQL